MSCTSAAIGERIRAFRKLKGLTQLALELELDASPGHISKIESNKVNPTKETVLKISQILELNLREQAILLGLSLDPLSPQAIQKAIAHTSDYLNQLDKPAYLSDDLWFVYAGNHHLLDMLGVPATPEARAAC